MTGSYNVQFYNPQSNNLHSAVTVEVSHPREAVAAALARVQEDYREDVSTLRAAIVDAVTGHGIPGIDKLATKSQLQAQAADLAARIAALEDDGTTADQNAAAGQTVPGWNPHAPAPPVPVPAYTGPSPSESGVEAGTPVSTADAPRGTAAPVFSQAEIDRQVAERQKDSGPAAG
jgi:hypothetical protein